MPFSELNITVVIPTYNRAQKISATLDSFFSQSCESFEIIVVDDGSTDETQLILQSYLNRFRNRLKVIKTNNGERGRARNLGTYAARGTYVNFFDSDDIAYPSHIQSAISAIKNFDMPEWFYLACDISTPNGARRMRANYSHPTLNDSLLDGNILGTNGVFVRRDIAISFPFHENRRLSGSEDYELWLRLRSKFSLQFDERSTSCLIEHEGRSMNTMPAEDIIRRIVYLIELIETSSEFADAKQAKLRVKSYLYGYLAVHLASANNFRRTSIKYLIASIVNNPSLISFRRILIVARDVFSRR